MMRYFILFFCYSLFCYSIDNQALICKQYVSKVENFFNSDCYIACMQGRKDLSSFCVREKHQIPTFDTVLDPTRDCYDNWVIGYSDEKLKHVHEKYVGVLFPTATTAAECQNECQKRWSCTWFQFRPYNAEKSHGCLLKSDEIVYSALTGFVCPKGYMETSHLYTSYCDRSLSEQCDNPEITFCAKKTDNRARCGYRDSNIIAGPKYCNRVTKDIVCFDETRAHTYYSGFPNVFLNGLSETPSLSLSEDSLSSEVPEVLNEKKTYMPLEVEYTVEEPETENNINAEHAVEEPETENNINAEHVEEPETENSIETKTDETRSVIDKLLEMSAALELKLSKIESTFDEVGKNDKFEIENSMFHGSLDFNGEKVSDLIKSPDGIITGKIKLTDDFTNKLSKFGIDKILQTADLGKTEFCTELNLKEKSFLYNPNCKEKNSEKRNLKIETPEDSEDDSHQKKKVVAIIVAAGSLVVLLSSAVIYYILCNNKENLIKKQFPVTEEDDSREFDVSPTINSQAFH